MCEKLKKELKTVLKLLFQIDWTECIVYDSVYIKLCKMQMNPKGQ